MLPLHHPTVEPVSGFEPLSPLYESGSLPLTYTGGKTLESRVRIELTLDRFADNRVPISPAAPDCYLAGDEP